MIELLEQLNAVDFTSADLYVGVAIGFIFRRRAQSMYRRILGFREERRNSGGTSESRKGSGDDSTDDSEEPSFGNGDFGDYPPGTQRSR